MASSPDLLQPKRSRPRRSAAAVILILILTMLSCAFFGSASDPNATISHLPTLTRTRLPTLTPTANVTPVAVALSTEATAPICESTSSPVESDRPGADIAPGAEPILPDNSATGAPPARADPAVTNSNAPAEAEAKEPAAQQPQAVAAAPTPTPLPPSETPTPTATATEAPPTPTEPALPTATPIPTATPLPQGWIFSGTHAYPVETLNGMVFYGNLINNTGGPQQLKAIDTTLYDAQGQVIPYEKAVDQWAVRAVPQGGQVPFGVVIQDVQGVADFNFEVQSEPGGDIPREDFEFMDINPSTEGGAYCLNGRLRNPGGQLQAYLMVTVVLYDGQDQVINYNNAFKSAPKEIVGDETLAVNLCVKTHQQQVDRYELRAWGL